MATHEEIEKVRQSIMRFRELLNIMQQNVESSEQAYSQLFSSLTESERQMKEKDQQWRVAEQIVNDTGQLERAVMKAQFAARQREKDFEELYNIIVTVPEE